MAIELSKGAKKQIIKKLREQGYATYARLLDLFDVYLTDDPNHVAYMIPNKAVVVFNKELSIDQVSTLARHEILHEYLTHMQRQNLFHKNNVKYLSDPELSNIAGDFEISNRGYTDADKATARSIKLNGKILKGLVTELDRPGWEDLSFEEMYKRLLEENEMTKDKLQDLLDRIRQLNPDNLDELSDQADQMSGDSDSMNPPPPSNRPNSQDQDSDSSSSDNGDENSNNNSDGKGKGTSMKPGDEDSENQLGSGDQSDDADEDSKGKGEDQDSEDSVDDENSKNQSKQDQAKKQLQKQAQQLGDAIDDIKDKVEKDSPADAPFKSSKDMRDQVDVAARVAQIEKLLKDIKLKEQMLDEVNVNKQKERAIKQARNIDRYNKSGISKFRMALTRFIANQLSTEDDDTWTRVRPSYEDSEFIFPGRMEKEEKHIPLINVYWDVSASFSDPRKTEGARKAIATLNQYVRNGDIEIETYYFANRVSSTPEEAGGGTEGQPILNHIAGTSPDNVIVITDGDISDCRNHITVPGAVWMLFYDRRSQNLMDHLHGKRETKYFDIDYR